MSDDRVQQVIDELDPTAAHEADWPVSRRQTLRALAAAGLLGAGSGSASAESAGGVIADEAFFSNYGSESVSDGWELTIDDDVFALTESEETIGLPDGDVGEEILLPNGAEASEMIAPDGSVVFEGDVIPDSGLYLDDWEDERLSERLFYDEVEYAFDPPEESAFDDPVRAEWTVESGDPATTGGVLIVTDTEGVSVFGDATAFTLHIEWQFADAPSSSSGVFNVMTSEPSSRFPSDGYAVNIESGGDYFLRERSSGNDIITGQWDADDLPHTTTLTRSSAGEWELFYDSTSVGTATDTSTDSAGNFAIYAPNDPVDWEVTRFEVF